MPTRVANKRERVVQVAFMTIYLAIIVAGFAVGSADASLLRGPRFFWTIGLPFAPMFMVLFGYYVWRRLCPLSLFAKFGAMIPRTKQRRVPAWAERWGMMIIFSTMFLSLGIRHLFTNGSGVFLGSFLLLIG